MDEAEILRRLLDEPPATEAEREREVAVLRERINHEIRAEQRSRWRVGVVAAASALVVGLLTIQHPPPAEAWSETPVVPPDPALVAAAPTVCRESASPPGDVLVVDQRDGIALALLGSRDSGGASTQRSCTLVQQGEDWVLASESDFPFAVDSMSGSVDEGLLGGQVDRVVIQSPVGDIDVSYSQGFFLVWWPEDIALTGEAIEFLADDGSILLELRVQPTP